VVNLEPVYANSDDPRRARLAAVQHGAVGLAQLFALGYLRHVVYRLVAQGWPHRLYPLAPAPGPQQRCRITGHMFRLNGRAHAIAGGGPVRQSQPLLPRGKSGC
jgi:hypothetical protein